jgi:hypothetical protein
LPHHRRSESKIADTTNGSRRPEVGSTVSYCRGILHAASGGFVDASTACKHSRPSSDEPAFQQCEFAGAWFQVPATRNAYRAGRPGASLAAASGVTGRTVAMTP